MYNFNYVLFGMDVFFIGFPFIAVEKGYPNLSIFCIGFAVMWIVMNVIQNKVTFKRYKLF